MGGGRKPKLLGNVVVKPPRIKPALLSTGSGIAVDVGGSGFVAELEQYEKYCNSFHR